MNNPFKREPSSLDEMIRDIEVLMFRHDNHSEEYQSLLKQYDKLIELRNSQKRKPIDPNVLLTVAANLTGILVVVNAERLSALSSKVWGLLMRPRS